MNIKNVVRVLRSSNFKKNSEQFLRVNRDAYVYARLIEEYDSQGNDDLAKDSIKEMAVGIDKSISVLRSIKNEADSIYKAVRTASFSYYSSRNGLSEALKCYVRIEKDWLKLNDIADAIERSGVSGQEDAIRSDFQNLFSDISMNAEKAIGILKGLRNDALSEYSKR